MTDQAKPAPRFWRRYLRFSVQALIVLVLLIGGWLGWYVRSARIQRQAVLALQKGNAYVAYNGDRRRGPRFEDEKPRALKWLEGYLGVDYFDHVIVVQCPSASDADLVHVGRLVQVEALVLGNSSISDAGLAHLTGLTQLQTLTLNHTQITDAGLAYLTGMTELDMLNLDETGVTDAGLAHLAGLTNLRHLSLNGDKLSGVGLPHLKGLTRLMGLELRNTQVTESAAGELTQALPRLNITR